MIRRLIRKVREAYYRPTLDVEKRIERRYQEAKEAENAKPPADPVERVFVHARSVLRRIYEQKRKPKSLIVWFPTTGNEAKSRPSKLGAQLSRMVGGATGPAESGVFLTATTLVGVVAAGSMLASSAVLIANVGQAKAQDIPSIPTPFGAAEQTPHAAQDSRVPSPVPSTSTGDRSRKVGISSSRIASAPAGSAAGYSGEISRNDRLQVDDQTSAEAVEKEITIAGNTIYITCGTPVRKAICDTYDSLPKAGGEK